MKKFVIAGVTIVLLSVIGGIVMLSQDGKDGTRTNTTATEGSRDSDTKTPAAKACQLITLDDARTLIGSNAVLLDGSGDPNLATTESVTVDNCSYSADGATLGDMMQLTIQVQSGPSAEIRQSYENYKKEYPGEALPGLGDEAYYSTENQQAVVLKGSSWLFVGAASMNTSKEQNKTQAIKSAEIALKKL